MSKTTSTKEAKLPQQEDAAIVTVTDMLVEELRAMRDCIMDASHDIIMEHGSYDDGYKRGLEEAVKTVRALR